MAIRRSSNRGPSRPRRKLVWARQTQTPSQVIAAATGVVYPLLASFQTSYGADPIGCTVRRIRGNLTLVGAAPNSIRMTVGIGVFDGLPTVANQGPANAPHLDWMYWRMFFAEPPLAAESIALNMVDVDVRAMRKMEELGQDLFMIVQNTHPTSGMALAWATSTLLALP